MLMIDVYAAAGTFAMRPPLTTVEQQAHVAAAAYLMKHAGTTALMVLNAQAGQPVGIITEADIARAVADGKDVNSTRIYELMHDGPGLTSQSPKRRQGSRPEQKRPLVDGGERLAALAAAASSRGAQAGRIP